MAKFKYGLTASEHKGFRPRCPKPECPGEIGQSMFSWGGYSQCHGCNRVFGWTDSRGSRVSKEQYGALVERWAGRPSRGAGMSCPAEEGVEMAKAKKAVKKAGPKAEKKTSGNSKSIKSAVFEALAKNQDLTPDEFMQIAREINPDTKQKPAYLAYFRGLAVKEGLILAKAEKAPVPVAKPKAAPKAVKKPVAKKAVAKKKEEPKQ